MLPVLLLLLLLILILTGGVWLLLPWPSGLPCRWPLPLGTIPVIPAPVSPHGCTDGGRTSSNGGSSP